MPNRILRDWTDSKNVDVLSFFDEVLFTRLIMKADDFGNFNYSPVIVKSLCFPRKDNLKTSDVADALKNLEAANLITVYQSDGDTFLHIRNFKQRLDKAKRRYPKEPDNDSVSVDNDSVSVDNDSFPETKRNETSAKRNADHAQNFLKVFGNTSDASFVLITPKEISSTKYRLHGIDGLDEFFQMQGSSLTHRDKAAKFMRSRNGKPYNDFGHLFNDYRSFTEKLLT